MRAASPSNAILKALASLTLAAMAACGDGGTGPDGGDGGRTAALQALAGGGQQATVATRLPEPLMVVALDADGAPVAGTRVHFGVSQNGGSVAPASATTDAQGRATTLWTLGTLAGTHRVTASVGIITAEFPAIANAGTPVSFALAQDSFALEPGMDSVLHFVALDAYGNASTTALPTFVVDDPGVASVNASGAVIAVGPGRTTVRAQLGTFQDQATLNVGFRFVDVVASYANTCARTVADRVHCWGLTQDLQSGQPRPGELCQVNAFCLRSPQIVTNDLAFTSVAPGQTHTCAVSNAAKLYCWGSNASLALGTGQTDWSYRTAQPQEVVATRSWRAVTADDAYACALTTDGAAYCWGKPGALGGGASPTLPVNAPAPVGGGIAFASIQAAAENVCGLTAQNDLYCWGSNGNGQHGTGARTVHATPVQAGGGAKYKAVSIGGAHACGIGMDDRIMCWGSNSHGQLGVLGIAESLAPTPVTTTLTFTAVAAGATHTCGIATDGAAYCWGDNFDGQLGNGFVGSGWQPRTVAGGLRFTRIHAKREFTCAIATDTRLYCWGDNDNGQLGDGGTADRVAPMRVLGQM